VSFTVSSSESSGDLMTKKYQPFPRILKRDIRRAYSTMYINVTNSGDASLIRRFFSQYCVPQCDFLDTFPFTVTPLHTGRDNVIDYIIAMTEVIPDLAMTLQTAGIHRLHPHDTASSVQCRTLTRGTKLYYSKVDCQLMQQHSHLPSNQLLQYDSSRPLLLPEPVAIDIVSTIKFQLDEQFRILRIEVCDFDIISNKAELFNHILKSVSS
jgi:hypothetical protein